MSLASIASTADCGMLEQETVLTPVSFGEGGATRFLGMTQALSDSSVLGGRPIAFERLVGSELLSESEPLSIRDNPPPPPPPPPSRPLEVLRSHPRAPHLRLVVSRPTVHARHEMDEAMLNLIAALDIVAKPVELSVIA
jgi:hypothetical protein